MTGQQLRNSILQEAIQARLVPNVLEPGEKTGAELLQQILKERQDRENKENGKKAKKLTLSTIEEEPWELPEGWCWCRVADLCELSDAKKVSGEYINMDAAFLRGKTTGSIIKSGRFVKAGSRMILVDGENSGEVFIAPCDGYLGSTFKELSIYMIDSARYLLLFLTFNKELFRNNKKGAAIPHLNKDIFRNLEIPLPPLSIQKAIVAKIEELLPLVDEYDKAAGELETLNKILPDKLRKSVLQEAIHGNLVSNDIPEGEATGAELLQQILKERQDRENKEKGKKAKKLTLSTIEEEPWKLPKGWCWCRIDDIAFVTKLAGFEYSKFIAPNLVPEGIPLFKGKNVQNGVINYSFESFIPKRVSDSLWRSKLNKKCILTPYVGTIGNVAIFDARVEAHLGSNVGKIELDNEMILNEYILYYLRCEDGLKELKKHKKATAQESISIDAIRDVFVPLPPLSIQRRIVEKIEEVFSAIDKLQA